MSLIPVKITQNDMSKICAHRIAISHATPKAFTEITYCHKKMHQRLTETNSMSRSMRRSLSSDVLFIMALPFWGFRLSMDRKLSDFIKMTCVFRR